MPSSSSKKRFSNLNSTISAAQCPTDWDYVDGKCYQVITEYHFRFNFVLWIARILQYFPAWTSWEAAAANCMGLCSPPSTMCHLARLYSQQQGMELRAYGKEFHENLLMYKLIWNIRFLNCVFFYFAALISLYSQRKLMVREAKSVFNIDFNV